MVSFAQNSVSKKQKQQYRETQATVILSQSLKGKLLLSLSLYIFIYKYLCVSWAHITRRVHCF